MPYINPEKREVCDKVVNVMIDCDIKADGDLNYILFKYCKYRVSASYNNYKNFCGELRQCVTEIERKLLAQYEELKESQNGSV